MVYFLVIFGEGFGVRESGSEWFRNLISEGFTWVLEVGIYVVFFCILVLFIILYVYRRF